MKTVRLSPLVFRLFAGGVALALIVGATGLAARRAERLLRADLLLHARLVATSLCPEHVAALTGTAADYASPNYHHLHARLTRIRNATPHCRFLYLMERRPDGVVIFTDDSEPIASKDHSPPGQTYDEAPEELPAAFAANQPIVRGPYVDRWGTWVSAFVPLPDPKSAMLGMDIDARDWKWIVAARAVLPAVLTAIAILLGLVAILLQQSRRKLGARQAELQESETRYVQLAEQSRTIAWEVDAQGLYTHVGPTVEAVLGYRPGELIGIKHFYDLHPEEGRAAFKQAAFQTFARKEPFVNFENAELAKDGQTRWLLTNGIPLLNADGTLRGYRGSDIDVTERKRSEEKVRALLAESNQSRQALLGILEDQTRAEADLKRLATAIEQTAEFIVVTDAQARIQYVNPAFVAVTGYTREEAIGQNPRILRSGRQDAAFYQAMWATLTSGKTWHGRLVNRCKDGTLYTEDALISPVTDATGQIVNYVAVKRDVTEQLRLEGQLQQSQKMTSIGRLAGGVAHDFNNMLGVILGHAEIAMNQTDPRHPLRADLQEIRNAALRSADLTRQLLAFARKQIVAPKVLDLNETIEGMLKMLRRLIGENIDLAWRPGRHLWPVKIDPSQIDQILANLCVNARDAIAGVGQVAIETDTVTVDADRAAESPGAAPGDYVRLTFRDTGIGMDSETLSHIFEPFFTTKKLGEGTGLGLSTVYGIVQQNNGFIQVLSEPDRGTTFHIYLPRHGDKSDPVPQEEPAAPPPGGRETILLVEDEPAVLNSTAQMIETLGYDVWKAGAPAEALRRVRESKGQIHLLVTDVVMPGMNGRDLAQQIRALHPGLKCLFMSGYTADIIARNGVLDQGVPFIQKPFSRRDLAAKIREVLDAS